MQRGQVAALIAGTVCLSPALARAQTLLTQKDVPITVTKSGSYILKSNLRVTDPKVTAILIDANDVTIDLNGFAIQGPQRVPESNGSAIKSGEGGANTVVKNGSIRGFYEQAAACIHLTGGGIGGSHRVENVHVQDCGGIAIYADGVVTRCQVTSSVNGIAVGLGGVVTDNTLFRIQGNGVAANDGGATIARNTVHTEAVCIRARGANRIEENTCSGGDAGLVLTSGANFYARNFLFGSTVPVVDGGAPNIDGGDIDPALANVQVPATSAP